MSLTPADLIAVTQSVKQALLTQVSSSVLAYLNGQGLAAPIAYWRMDALSGVTEADVSGNGNTLTYNNSGGTLTGITLGQSGVTQDGDTAVLFSGPNYAGGAATMPATTEGQALTIVFYAYLAGYPASDSLLVWVALGGDISYGLLVHSDGTLGEYTADPSGHFTSAIPLNQWVQIAVVFSPASEANFYFNLANVGSTGGFSPLITTRAGPQTAYLGNTAAYSLTLDEVMIHPAALTLAQLGAIDAIVRGVPNLASPVNVNQWAGLAVPASLPNSGPVALTAAACDAVARAILGQGISDNPGSSCVVNRAKTLPFFCGARYERAVFIGIGDSNQVKDSYGWNCAFGYALANSGGLWGTGLLAANANVGQSLSYLAVAGGSGASTGAPAALDAYMPAVTGMPFYTYTASGTPTDGVVLQPNWPGNTNGDLSVHLTYGVNPGWTGTFEVGGRYENAGFAALPPFVPAATSISTGTGGSAGLVDGTWEYAAGTLTPGAQVDFDFGTHSNSTGSGSGPTFFTYWQAENRDIHSGFSAHTLLFYGGVSTRVALTSLQSWGAQALQEHLRQAMLYAGPSKLCCFRICEGLNDRGDTNASWNKAAQVFSGPASNTQQGFYNNTEAIMLLVQQAWAVNGFPASSLYFQLTVSHPLSLPDDTSLSSYRAATDTLSSAYANTCSVHLERVTSFAELSSNQYYESGTAGVGQAANSAHLIAPGYNDVATREIAAVQPTGVEVIIDAAQRALAASLPPNTAGVGPYALSTNGGTGAAGAPITSGGTTIGTDGLRVVNSSGNGIEGATLDLYAASDSTLSELLGSATTGHDGRWLGPIYCNSGTYQLVTSAIGEQSNIQSIVVP
jgi:hypothetical protein